MNAKARKRTGGATRRVQQPTSAVSGVRLQQWFNRSLIIVAVAGVALATGWGLRQLKAMPVKHILISGDVHHLPTERVKTLVQPWLAGGFLGADLSMIRERLMELPWVYEASVRRRWPDEVVIKLTGQTPIARWGANAFLNHEGDVFVSDGSASDLQSLPLLRGPQGMQKVMMSDYLRLHDALQPLQLRIETLVMDARGELRAKVNKGFWLVLGREDLMARLKRFEQVYSSRLALGEPLEKIDLRYNNGMAVSFAQVPSVAGL